MSISFFLLALLSCKPRCLTMLLQPMSLAVLDSGGGYTLFVPDQDSWREQWDGVRLNPDAATELYGAHQAFPMAEVGC